MSNQFNESAKALMALARAEAHRLNHVQVDTEHLLLGLLKKRTGKAADVLRNCGVDTDTLRAAVEAMVESGPSIATRGDLPLAPGVERVIRRSMEEAHNFGQEHVGSEHILLGLFQEHEGVAYRALRSLAQELDKIRDEIRNLNSIQSSQESIGSEPGRCNQTAAGDSRASSDSGDSSDDYEITDDTMADTSLGEISSSEIPLDEIEGDVNLDSFGNGSALLDLSLQADDTSLGGILDEIYTAEDEHPVSPEDTSSTIEDPYAGHELQLCLLPDDVDYLQHLASELNKYSHKRQAQQEDRVTNVLEGLELPGELLSKILKAGVTSIADLCVHDAQSLTSNINLDSHEVQTLTELCARKGLSLGTHTAWGIDVGNSALKAVRLSAVGTQFEVVGVDVIEYPEMLRLPETDRNQFLEEVLKEFFARNDTSRSKVAIAVPDHVFCGRDFLSVEEVLPYLASVSIKLNILQIASFALCNFFVYDRKLDSDAIMLLDVGAGKTNLIISDREGIWNRASRIGGNTFTKAIAETFKLEFKKAEILKCSALTSKYQRQLLKSMRPVFTDLASEVQNSLDLYKNSNPNTKVARVIALGGGTKLCGLVKYLQQTLQMPAEKLEQYNQLNVTKVLDNSTFTENVPLLGVAYGLALQALGRAFINLNLFDTSSTEDLFQKCENGMRAKRAGKTTLTDMNSILMSDGLRIEMTSEGLSRYRWLSVPPIEKLRGRTLGRILIIMGILSREQIHDCLKIQGQQQDKIQIGEILLEQGLIKEEQLLIALAAQRGMEYVCLDEVDIQPWVIEKVPTTMAMTYRLIPIEFDEHLNQLVVALDNPQNFRATDDLSVLMGFKVAARITESGTLDEMLAKHYSTEEKATTEHKQKDQSKNIQVDSPYITTAELSPFSYIHLLLFRAEGAARHRDFHEASRLVNESMRVIAKMISESLTDAIDELNSRVDYISDSLDEENVNVYLDEIADLRTNKRLKLGTRISRFERLLSQIAQLIHNQPTIVCKTNVLKHGVRNVIEIEEGWTLSKLAEVIKDKYRNQIKEYLYRIHKKRIRIRHVRIRFLSDSSHGGVSTEELDMNKLVVAIPDRDTDGVIWYPEWIHSDGNVYRNDQRAEAPTQSRGTDGTIEELDPDDSDSFLAELEDI